MGFLWFFLLAFIGWTICIILVDENDALCFLSGIIGFFFTVIFLIALGSYCCSIGTYGELTGIKNSVFSYEQISKETKDAYYSITPETASIKINNQVAIQLGLENIKQSTNVSDALATLRDAIVKYNVTLGKYRSYNSNWFTALFVAKLPAELKPIQVSTNILK